MLTTEQYLEIERAAEFRSEYYNGRMYAMSGASFRHVIITGNVARALGNHLHNSPCVVATNDFRVRVSPGGLYAYPDIVVVCGEPQFADNMTDTLLNPVLLIEVLSPSTEAYDRGFKSAQYRTLESLQEYALVSQSEPRMEVFRRQPGGQWLFSEYVGWDGVCVFQSVDASVALSQVYEKVRFDEPPEPAATHL